MLLHWEDKSLPHWGPGTDVQTGSSRERTLGQPLRLKPGAMDGMHANQGWLTVLEKQRAERCPALGETSGSAAVG